MCRHMCSRWSVIISKHVSQLLNTGEVFGVKTLQLFCLLDYQCRALCQSILMSYQYLVHKIAVFPVAFYGWYTLLSTWTVERECLFEHHFCSVSVILAILDLALLVDLMGVWFHFPSV